MEHNITDISPLSLNNKEKPTVAFDHTRLIKLLLYGRFGTNIQHETRSLYITSVSDTAVSFREFITDKIRNVTSEINVTKPIAAFNDYVKGYTLYDNTPQRIESREPNFKLYKVGTVNSKGEVIEGLCVKPKDKIKSKFVKTISSVIALNCHGHYTKDGGFVVPNSTDAAMVIEMLDRKATKMWL